MVKTRTTHAWKSRGRNRSAGRRLWLEELEHRRVLATAGIDLVGGVLEIDGTGNDDMITIAYEDPADVGGNVVATIRKSNGSLLAQETYDRLDITSLIVRAFGGNDRVTNVTDIADTMEGGEGKEHVARRRW